MYGAWLLMALVPAISACVPALIALHRASSRRSHLERIALRLPPGSRVVDQDADGAVLEIVIGHAEPVAPPSADELPE